jgi:PhzF family phenazine biosynthesis protein
MPAADATPLSYAAFTDDPAGGNPAGVVLDARGLDDDDMLAIAAHLGHSETAFLTATDSPGVLDVRYFAPEKEVTFCGHATIASAVAWGERHGPGPLELHTQAGVVTVEVEDQGGRLTATLTSVAPSVTALADEDLDELLAALGWAREDLDPALAPAVGYAGARHPVIAAATRERLADLDYDYERLKRLMLERDWTTIQLVWREAPDVFQSRNPFAPGGVVEDPATGAAAAAFGAYLRDRGLVAPPARITIHQGIDLGRPSLIGVDIPEGADTGIRVTGLAVPMS